MPLLRIIAINVEKCKQNFLKFIHENTSLHLKIIGLKWASTSLIGAQPAETQNKVNSETVVYFLNYSPKDFLIFSHISTPFTRKRVPRAYAWRWRLKSHSELKSLHPKWLIARQLQNYLLPATKLMRQAKMYFKSYDYDSKCHVVKW